MMGTSKETRREITPGMRRAIAAWMIQAALGVPGYGGILFLAAGTMAWIWGWVLLGVLTAVLVAHVLILVPTNPELLVEREKCCFNACCSGLSSWRVSRDSALPSLVSGNVSQMP